MNVLLSFGHGYSAQAFSKTLPRAEWVIKGTTRSEVNFEQISASNAEPLIWPVKSYDITKVLENTTHLLISTGPTEQGDPVLNQLKSTLNKLASQFKWVGYLSTTAVYGDHKGGWVDETASTAPTTLRGKWRKQAELEWLDTDLPVHIFRLAGIYGPGRGPFEKIRNGTARSIIKKQQVFSRIHVEDIARVLQASICQPNPGAIYNVCDDLAAPPEDVLEYAASLLNMPAPVRMKYENADLSPMAKSFYSESKRVSNRKIKKELGVILKHQDYKTGLLSLLK